MSLDQDERGRRLVDLAALDSDHAVLDHVDPPDPVRTGALIQLGDEVDEAELLAVERDREAAGEADHELGRLGRLVGIDGQLERLLRRRHPRILEDPGLDRAAEEVGIDRVGRGVRLHHRDAPLERVGDLLVARPHPVAERGDDAHPRIGRAQGDLEPELVVALAGAAVDDCVGPEVVRDGGHSLGDHRAGERGDQRVLALVERVGLQGFGHLDSGEFLPQVGDDDVVRPGGATARHRGLDLDLLADVDEHRDDLVEAVVLLEPGDRAARVEPAGEGQDRDLAHAAPSSRCPRSSSRSSAPEMPSRVTTRTVFSPAIVPAICACPESSRA